MAEPKFLVVPEEYRDELAELLSQPAGRLDALCGQLVRIENLLTRHRVSRAHTLLAEALETTITAAVKCFGALYNLKLQVQEHDISREDFFSDLALCVPAAFAAMEADARTSLVRLVYPSEDSVGQLQRKANRLTQEFAPFVVGARSICDIRPVFDAARKSVEGAVFVTKIGLSVIDPSTAKERLMVFQFDDESLRVLRKCINTIDKKKMAMTAVMRPDLPLLSTLLDDSEDEEESAWDESRPDGRPRDSDDGFDGPGELGESEGGS